MRSEDQHPYASVLRNGNLVAFGGQNSTSSDFDNQVGEVVGKISDLLGQVEATLRDLVKLVVFYRPANGISEQRIRKRLSFCLQPAEGIALTLVAVRDLAEADSLVEIEGYAMTGETGSVLQRRSVTLVDLAAPGDAFCHGLRCGEFVFVSGQSAKDINGKPLFADLARQNRQVLENIERILKALDVDREDIVKANTWRLPPADAEQYRTAAEDRFAFFATARPAVTGITVPDVAGDNLLITIDVWAMRSLDNTRVPKQSIQPENHWDWSVDTPYSHGLRCGRYLFVAGQAALNQNGDVVQAGDIAAQTRITMDFVERILRAAAASFADVVKINTLYLPGKNGDNYRQCLQGRNRYIQSNSPASTAIPVDALAYYQQMVEVEAIAILDR